MGTGKTVTTLAALRQGDVQEGLLCVPKIVLGVWEKHFKLWYPEAFTFVYTGHINNRKFVWEAFQDAPRPKFLITNYAQLEEVRKKQYYWNTVVFDECHNIKNRKTKAAQQASVLRHKYLWLLSGTPMSRGPQDLYMYLHLIDPVKFHSFWPFVNRWCQVYSGFNNSKQIGGPKDAAALRDYIAPYVKRRLKKDVLKDLPPKTRDALTVDLLPEQQQMYVDIVKNQLTFTEDGELLLTRGTLAVITRLRQICINPAIIGGPNKSAGFNVIKEFAEALDAPIALYTPWTEVYPYLLSHIQGFSGGWEAFVLRGGMDPRRVSEVVEGFETSKNRRRFLIATTSLGVGYTAVSTSHSIFLGADWDPNKDFQCEDRQHREGQKNAVNVYYIVNNGTIERHVLDVVEQKTTWNDLSLDGRLLIGGATRKGR